MPVTAVDDNVLLCRGSLYVEAAEGQAWGWYSPHQIPSLIAWLETGSQQEQQLAEELYTMYQPVLRLVASSSQVCICKPICHCHLWTSNHASNSSLGGQLVTAEIPHPGHE